jgi:apolipoprotein N-acyltransferase
MVTLNHVSATQALAREVSAGKKPAPDVVIWPENSTDIDPTKYPPVYQEIASAAAAIKTPILVGAVLQNPVRNASLLWLPGKGPVATYLKQKLVPFGEYIPLRSLISKITPLTALQPENFVAGNKTVVFSVGKIRLSAMICWEVGFDSIARSEVAAGANLLTMPSNDATYEREGETTGESGQQLAMARIRAVEHDRSVVVASTTGYSAIIAPDGQPIVRSGIWQQAELEARVPLVTYTTLADRAGAWPEYGIVAATVLGVVLAAGLSWRRRQISPHPVSSTPGAEGDIA